MKRWQAPFYRIVLCLTLLFGVVVLATCINPIPTIPAATSVALIASSAATVSPTPIPEQGKGFTEDLIIICPTKNLPTSVSIWMTSPQNGYPIAQAFDEFGYGYPDSMDFNFTQPLEAITRMTVQTFYETFSDPNATTCLVVPRDKGDMAP